MNVLVLNCGSSSLKFQLIATDLERISQDADRRLAHGQIERVGGAAIITLAAEGRAEQRSAAPVRDIRAALETVLRWITSEAAGIEGIGSLAAIDAVGHRVVHGGEKFRQSVLISDEILRGIEDCIELAPLHNPANIRGISAAREIFGRNVPQAAVFDTAFHQTLPEQSYLYALPYQLYRRHRIRRYGFHGTSHRYVAYRYRRLRQIARDELNIITLHLGNGCSIAAIKNGNSTDTSMGLTPLEGLVMGTRAGDVDAAILEFIGDKEGLTIHEVEMLLNKQSGLLGISGLTNDMRELLAEADESGDRRARLAIEIFCYRARKYIGAYLAAMNGADAVIFTGGIGENSARIRALICEELKWLGVELDDERNRAHTQGREGVISRDDSRLSVYVIPTNEELLIARDTVRLIHSSGTNPSQG
ncbi:MAG TPA: acetate kinase [Pyrinomonadaceae bacterium]|nr:acetate kinase [Pyrinomonadaceae bacterium]